MGHNLYLFGSLLFWPVLRFVIGVKPENITLLKWQFLVQIVGMVLGYGIVYYYWSIGNQDWWMAHMFPQFFSILGWVMALLGLIILACRKSSGRRS